MNLTNMFILQEKRKTNYDISKILYFTIDYEHYINSEERLNIQQEQDSKIRVKGNSCVGNVLRKRFEKHENSVRHGIEIRNQSTHSTESFSS